MTNKEEVVHELKKTADWKTAYVIGLAGVLLVTGADPPTINGAGGLGWIVIITTVIIGAIYCFFLAELATRFPEKTGGLPTYAIEGFRDKKWGGVLGGVTNWSYWLGWFPVVSINAALMAQYTAYLGGFSSTFYNTSTYLPSNWEGYLYILAFTAAVAGALWIINYLGLSMGFGVCLVLGILALVPLLFMSFGALATGHITWSLVFPLSTGAAGTVSSATAVLWKIMPWFFIMTWNALAMETAACYVGECKNPRKDAPRALIAEGVTGIIVYTFIGLTLLGYIGSANSNWVSILNTLKFLGSWSTDVVTISLFAALMLSTLGAFLGCCRALYQSSIEGLTLKWFGRLNKNGAPVRACSFSFIMVLIVSMIGAGLPTLIYILSNVGYLLAFIPTGLAFIRLKLGYKGAPQIKDLSKVFLLPKWMAGVAVVIVAFFIFIWGAMGPISGYTVDVVTGAPPITFWLVGIAIVLASIPMYYHRQSQEKKLAGSKLVQGSADYQKPNETNTPNTQKT